MTAADLLSVSRALGFVLTRMIPFSLFVTFVSACSTPISRTIVVVVFNTLCNFSSVFLEHSAEVIQLLSSDSARIVQWEFLDEKPSLGYASCQDHVLVIIPHSDKTEHVVFRRLRSKTR